MVPHAHKSMPLKVFALHFSVYSNSKHLQEEAWFRRFSHAPYHPLPTPNDLDRRQGGDLQVHLTNKEADTHLYRWNGLPRVHLALEGHDLRT